jgi:chemotaxis response regulator CheB
LADDLDDGRRKGTSPLGGGHQGNESDARRPAIELVVLLASAGGLNALSFVLRDLPANLPVAVVVQQHLGA